MQRLKSPRFKPIQIRLPDFILKTIKEQVKGKLLFGINNQTIILQIITDFIVSQSNSNKDANILEAGFEKNRREDFDLSENLSEKFRKLEIEKRISQRNESGQKPRMEKIKFTIPPNVYKTLGALFISYSKFSEEGKRKVPKIIRDIILAWLFDKKYVH